jgi:hypothetical protein
MLSPRPHAKILLIDKNMGDFFLNSDGAGTTFRRDMMILHMKKKLIN